MYNVKKNLLFVCKNLLDKVHLSSMIVIIIINHQFKKQTKNLVI